MQTEQDDCSSTCNTSRQEEKPCQQNSSSLRRKSKKETENESYSDQSGSLRQRSHRHIHRFVSLVRSFSSSSHGRSAVDSPDCEVSPSVFTLPQMLPSSDFSLLPYVHCAEQHHYPRELFPLRGKQITNTLTRVGRHCRRPVLLNALPNTSLPAAFQHLPAAPESLELLMRSKESELQCPEYIKLYLALVKNLVETHTAWTERLRSSFYPRMSYEAYMYNLCQNDPIARRSLFAYFDEDGVHSRISPDDYYNRSLCPRPPALDAPRYSSYTGFMMPAPLRFEGGSRSFGEYMWYFCSKLTEIASLSYNNYAGYQKRGPVTAAADAKEEVLELMRKHCAGALLRSMAVVEHKNPMHYLCGVEYGKGGWTPSAALEPVRGLILRNHRIDSDYFTHSHAFTTTSVAHRASRHHYTPHKNGHMANVSFTVDRNYIWRRRAEVILCPEIVLWEDDEDAAARQEPSQLEMSVWQDCGEKTSIEEYVREKFGDFLERRLSVTEIIPCELQKRGSAKAASCNKSDAAVVEVEYPGSPTSVTVSSATDKSGSDVAKSEYRSPGSTALTRARIVKWIKGVERNIGQDRNNTF
ncbi:hypothetical protein BZA70DRAFT_287564 [Myxozyma melibiosi]|uniref:Uncharacterized protein n=1 Tax=Myxozyma melibiosi TaxID=54550 RepID=A0ABR1FEG5_9ASCO